MLHDQLDRNFVVAASRDDDVGVRHGRGDVIGVRRLHHRRVLFQNALQVASTLCDVSGKWRHGESSSTKGRNERQTFSSGAPNECRSRCRRKSSCRALPAPPRCGRSGCPRRWSRWHRTSSSWWPRERASRSCKRELPPSVLPSASSMSPASAQNRTHPDGQSCIHSARPARAASCWGSCKSNPSTAAWPTAHRGIRWFSVRRSSCPMRSRRKFQSRRDRRATHPICCTTVVALNGNSRINEKFQANFAFALFTSCVNCSVVGNSDDRLVRANRVVAGWCRSLTTRAIPTHPRSGSNAKPGDRRRRRWQCWVTFSFKSAVVRVNRSGLSLGPLVQIAKRDGKREWERFGVWLEGQGWVSETEISHSCEAKRRQRPFNPFIFATVFHPCS